MKPQFPLKIRIETDRYVVSSLTRVFKTERFIHDTRKFAASDAYLTCVSDGIIYCGLLQNSLDLKKGILNTENGGFDYDCFKIWAKGLDYYLYFKTGAQIGENFDVRAEDIIFFKCEFSSTDVKRNDVRLSEFLRLNPEFEIFAEPVKDLSSPEDFLKLYVMSSSDGVNFPYLNKEQRALVETEDKNVLVQGVAGSGKTNICIDKIVYSACRNYRGRILYSTYSRGLLLDTKNKVGAFISALRLFYESYSTGRVMFADENHKKGIEDKLGVYFDADEDGKIAAAADKLADYLEHNVDYFLPEDLYKKHVDPELKMSGESYFVRNFIKNISNHQLRSRLDKVKNLSFEVVYKEIHGLIFGSYDPESHSDMLSYEEYAKLRKESFSAQECDTIYALSKDYAAYMKKEGLTDDNAISRELLKNKDKIDKYSLIVLDEVQDMTEVTLFAMKSIARKLFCVGDALQMINPSYFSFAYLKRIMYEKDAVSVAQLSSNYRNTQKIAEMIDGLADLSEKQFGTHNFVVKAKSVESDVPTSAVYVRGQEFVKELAKNDFENFTLIVSDNRRKEILRKLFKTQEILTVSESKGLERDTVVLYNVLSDYADKWRALERLSVNRKLADENSVYRYYYNLFYVGLSRAKANIYVSESDSPPSFDEFFRVNFIAADCMRAIESLNGIVSRAETDQDEIVRRVREFVRLEQFENARFAAAKIADGIERGREINKIDVYENYVAHGDYRGAGVRYWELGMPNDAKEQFKLSGDEILIKFVDAAASDDSAELDIGILDYLADFAENSVAMKLVTDTVKRDLEDIKNIQKKIDGAFKAFKEKKWITAT